MVTNFHGKRFAGSLQWRAPEYVQGRKHYYKKPPNYWCDECMKEEPNKGPTSGNGYMPGRSTSHSSKTTNQTSRTQGIDMGDCHNFLFNCINCRSQVIFNYYKKADIYAAGLVRFSNSPKYNIYKLMILLKTNISIMVHFQNNSPMRP